MFTHSVIEFLAYFILIPAIIGIARFKRMLPSYRPFIFLIWLGALNEIVGSLSQHTYQTNAINSNIFVLVEGLLLLWMFFKWYSKTKQLIISFLITAILFIILWVTDNIILHPITNINSIYRICYSGVIVFLSIDKINETVMQEKESLLKNARFLLCTGFILFYAYRMVFEGFYVHNFGLSNNFYTNLFDIQVLINLFCNLIFALAILWIPTKQRFTLQY